MNNNNDSNNANNNKTGSINVAVSSEKLQQLKDATDVVESVVAKQREEIAHAQAGYDALYERFTALSSKMYDALQELNAYKLRVDELEGKKKKKFWFFFFLFMLFQR